VTIISLDNYVTYPFPGSIFIIKATSKYLKVKFCYKITMNKNFSVFSHGLGDYRIVPVIRNIQVIHHGNVEYSPPQISHTYRNTLTYYLILIFYEKNKLPLWNLQESLGKMFKFMTM
jgi:hypothetical protein